MRGPGMLRGGLRDIVVAVAASLVTWALTHRGDPSSEAGRFVAGVIAWVARVGGPVDAWLWLACAILSAAGLALQIWSMAPARRDSGLEWELSMPSLATTLIGLGLALGGTSVTVALADGGSYWSLPSGLATVYWVWRWAARLKYRWDVTWGAGAL